jgi:hypothetical protein
VAQRLEPLDVQGDVVVDDEDRLRAVTAGIGDVGHDALDRVRVKVTAAHLDDRAETAVKRTAARGFDHVHRPAHEGIAAEDTGATVRQARRMRREPRDRPIGVRDESGPRPIGEAGDRLERVLRFDRTQKRVERLFALAADQEFDVVTRLIRLRRQTRVVPARDDARAGAQAPDEARDVEGGGALERHDRHADDIRLQILDQPLHGCRDARSRQDEIGDRHVMVRVEIAGERRERTVRHADGDRRRVLERIRHREQKHVHDGSDLPYATTERTEI